RMPMPVPRAPSPIPSAPAPPAPAAAQLTPELAHYFELLSGVENASRCLILGENDAIVGEAPVKEMIEAISALTEPAKAIIFDGIVSQRLLDVAQEKGIGTVVGTRLGPVGKIPETIRIFTKADLAVPGAAR
ncbi:MAG: hypothetical protein WB789_04080, partial [Thermoplasmata archaeon]